MQEYRETNAGKLAEYQSEYREINAGKIAEYQSEYQSEYREINAGKIAEYQSERRDVLQLAKRRDAELAAAQLHPDEPILEFASTEMKIFIETLVQRPVQGTAHFGDSTRLALSEDEKQESLERIMNHYGGYLGVTGKVYTVWFFLYFVNLCHCYVLGSI